MDMFGNLQQTLFFPHCPPMSPNQNAQLCCAMSQMFTSPTDVSEVDETDQVPLTPPPLFDLSIP